MPDNPIISEIDRENSNFIEPKKILKLIKDQLEAIMLTDTSYYSKYKFEIVNEQYYVPDEEREPGRIYIVVRFLPADVDFGQDVVPITIQAVSECNCLQVTQRLLLEYAQLFNLKVRRDETNQLIYQNYTTPSVISNFETVYEGFRSILSMSGSIVLSKNINRITAVYYDGDTLTDVTALPATQGNYDLIRYNNKIYKWDNEGWKEYGGEEIDFLNFTDHFDATPDTQPYFSNQNFTESVIKYGSYAFNISVFLTDDTLNNKVLSIKVRNKPMNVNFYFKISYDNGLSMPLVPFKFINATSTQNKGELPSTVMAFAN